MGFRCKCNITRKQKLSFQNFIVHFSVDTQFVTEIDELDIHQQHLTEVINVRLLQRPGFNPRVVNMGFMVDKY
jgi:hypothetical protein